MTTETTTHTDLIPCGAADDCYHLPCLDCDEPMRTSHQPEEEHPGTVIHRRANTCKRCAWTTTRLTPADLQDQRHQLLSDEEMLHIMVESPEMFTWHALRRKRLRLGEYA